MRLARLFLPSACGLLLFNAATALAARLTGSTLPQRPKAVIVVTPQQESATLADFA
jgi:hypothetical protein